MLFRLGAGKPVYENEDSEFRTVDKTTGNQYTTCPKNSHGSSVLRRGVLWRVIITYTLKGQALKIKLLQEEKATL